LVLAACGQAQPRESAQIAHDKSEAAPPEATPRVEPAEAGSEVQEASAKSATRSCQGNEAPSPLAQAAFAGDIEKARLLVVQAEQADASLPAGCTATPLMMAISPYSEEPGSPPSAARTRTHGKLDAAGLLLARCFDITGSDAQGMQALHVAATAPYPEHVVVRLIERMFECGAQPDARTNQGVTPLMLAVTAKRKGLVKLFVEAGADVNAQSEAGDSPMGLADKNRDLLSLLRKAPARDGGT
jgi:hypothetical protein